MAVAGIAPKARAPAEGRDVIEAFMRRDEEEETVFTVLLKGTVSLLCTAGAGTITRITCSGCCCCR